MALKWASKANENDRTMPRDCWIFYVAVHWWLWPRSVLCVYVGLTKNITQTMRPYAHKYAFSSIVWNCLNWYRCVSFLFTFFCYCLCDRPPQCDQRPNGENRKKWNNKFFSNIDKWPKKGLWHIQMALLWKQVVNI